MIPINQVLSKIRWDEEYSKGHRFEIGYLDKVLGASVTVLVTDIILEKGNSFSFTIMNENEEITIPFHRVRTVYCDGKIIWDRPISKEL